ncbi:MAG: DUF2306 domain-containing protein [Cyclobacteriaceae bacterium]|nr:DUF2306 domain-containing protein [Cyclobacteriaceae bacterium]
MKKLNWVLFAFFSIGVGLYPIIYLLMQSKFGLLFTKSDELLASKVWNFAFYQHIIFGGVALLTGWSQFSVKIRNKYLNTHRWLGKIYVTVCLLSGSAALYLAIYATGGEIAGLGFGMLAVSWIFTTTKAFLSIRQKQINQHQAWMIRSYALTWAAVTLRIYLPLGQMAHFDFIEAYRVIAWLCWVPNLLVAEWIVSRLKVGPHPASLHGSPLPVERGRR